MYIYLLEQRPKSRSSLRKKHYITYIYLLIYIHLYIDILQGLQQGAEPCSRLRSKKGGWGNKLFIYVCMYIDIPAAA